MLFFDQKHKSLKNLVQELALEVVEMREDIHLSKMVEKLDQLGVKIYSHRDAWK